MPKVSIIIPVYNGGEYLERCLEGLHRQTLQDKEVIFVDDGSTDHTLSLLKSCSKSENVVLSQENAGAGSARNLGLAHAKGEYVAFLDVDDQFAADDTLERLYRCAKENEANVCGGSFVWDEAPLQDEKYTFQQDGYISYAEYQQDFGFTRYIYRREFLLEHSIRFPRYRVYEDPVFFLQVMVAAQGFYAIAEPVYVYAGPHQTELDVTKTVDYLHAMADNLRLSAKHGYGKLHKILFDRSESVASYYAEKNLRYGSNALFEAIIAVNTALDKELLRKEGIHISDDYLIPALQTVWNAGRNYLALRKMFSWFPFRNRGVTKK